MKFENLNLKPALLKNIADMGFVDASEIQEKAIPLALEGKDLIGLAQTGTGKTAAFGLPTLNGVVPNKKTQMLVIAPTRELVMQVAKSFEVFAKGTDIKCLTIYGGSSYERQIMALRRGVEVIIATPGRLMDLMDKKAVNLTELKFTVLDEADEMLNMGFVEDITKILKSRPADCQTLLFSATMPKAIAMLSKQFLKNPVVIDTVPKNVSKDSITQAYFNVKSDGKLTIINRLLTIENPKLVIVFTNTKIAASDIAHDLKSKGHSAEAIHGDLDQKERERAMARFRNGAVKVLCATDVAARGIDVANVDMVINFDLPNEKEYYIHRIGRTGRAGRTGKAYSFVCNGKDRSQLRFIEKYAGNPILEKSAPSASEYYNKQVEYLVENLHYEENKAVEDLLLNLNERGLDNTLIAKALLSRNLPVKEQEIGIGTKAVGPRNESKREDYSQIAFSVGKNHRITPPTIVAFIKNNSDIYARNIGDIDIFKDETLVEIPSARVKQAVRMLNGRRLGNMIVEVKVAE
jgi:ATP-dependent RNA helicase DeaD